MFSPKALPAPARPRHSMDGGVFYPAVSRWAAAIFLIIAIATGARANVPGGIVSGGANVTLVDNGTTVTMSNGTVSFLCTKASATITQINYTYNNGAGTKTQQMLNGGTDGGELYWEYGGWGGSASTYSLVVNPAVGDANHNVGDYAEIDMISTSSTAGTVDVHFSMLRGSPGFYVTAIWNHRAQDTITGLGETRTNIYAGSIFNWMSVDPGRNKLMEVATTATTIPVWGAPVECYMWTNGIYQGRYDDKYKYSADFGLQQYTTANPQGNQRTWGWSSVGTGGLNLGLWDVNASQEYYNAGPMKRELMSHIGTTILNMFNGDHFFEDIDSTYAPGENWTKTYGPYFVYCNNVATSNTNSSTASSLLYNDAVAQAAAEATGTASGAGLTEDATAWPYNWFINANYATAAGRGTVTGQIVVSDSGNPGASGSNMFVCLVQQPSTSVATYDFQAWMKPYSFFTRADVNGNFTIPSVISGTNYTLYAWGAGAPSELMSKAQTGGAPPLLYNLPSPQFGVTVNSGSTTNLGVITWTPTRVGPTVFEIGYPDRTARKFRHGEDFWVGDIGPSPTSPSPIWTKYLEYPIDFPNGPNYIVGTSRWSTDWNFVQPVVTSTAGLYNDSSSNITFTLPSTPVTGGSAALYIGLASNLSDAVIVTVNTTHNLGSTTGVTSVPAGNASTGYTPTDNDCDSTIREGNNGMFTEERLTFPNSLLVKGTNIINISIRQTGGTYFADHFMYDYLRLEVAGYVPPPPAGISAYPGNNSALLSWPVVPGATNYTISRSTTSGAGFAVLTSTAMGPVSGSGMENATYLDTTATNDTPYFYQVQAANTVGTSATSAQSTAVTPTSASATSVPGAVSGLVATPSPNQVALSWTAAAGANYYTIQRTTWYDNGGGTFNNLGTIALSDTVTGTTYTNASLTNGCIYSYTITGVNAAGTGASVTSSNAVAVAVAPTGAPVLAGTSSGVNQVTLSWTAVSGALGYVVESSTSPTGPFTIVASLTQLTYTNTGLTANTTYYYEVFPNNTGGTGGASNIANATTSPPAPSSLTATAGNAQVLLSWPAVAAANSYRIERGTVTGGPYGIIGASSGASYVDSGLTNGSTYYYVVASVNANGTGTTSAQATATPNASLPTAPGDLTATASGSSIVLSWNAVVGATSYQVYRATVNGGPYSTAINRPVTVATTTDTSAASGTLYYYVVVAQGAAGTSSYSNQAVAEVGGVPLVTWTGSTSTVWDSSTANWTGSNGTAVAYANPDDVSFGDTATTGTIALGANLMSPGLVSFSNAAVPYFLSSSGFGIVGGASIIKSGTGRVTLTGTESYAGGTVIDGGILAAGADGATASGTMECPGVVGAGGVNGSFGTTSNPIQINTGGQLRFGGQGGSSIFTYVTPNPIILNGGSIYSIYSLQQLTGGVTVNGGSLLPTYVSKNLAINSMLSGTGNLTIDDWQGPTATTGGAVIIQSASNSYSGQVTINAPSSGFLGGVMELTTTNALPNATILDNNTSSNGLLFTVTPTQIGALAGPGNIVLSESGSATTAVAFNTGNDGASTTYSGILSGVGSLTKSGSGTMILTGNNTYTGATNVTGGTLEIIGKVTSSASASVSSGALLYISGTMTVPGAFTNNGTVKLSGSGLLTVAGIFTNNGVLDLINGNQTLPPGLVNNGTVLLASTVQAQQMALSGTGFALTVQGYPQHTYQLQSTQSLGAPVTWTNIGGPQTGSGTPLSFSDPSATGSSGFYRVQVSP